MIVSDQDINGGMKLDACNLGTRKHTLHIRIINIVDRIASDSAEDRLQTANDPNLATLENLVIADNVMANVFFRPSFVDGPFDRIHINTAGVVCPPIDGTITVAKDSHPDRD